MLPRVAVIVVPAVRDPDTEGEPVNAGLAPVAPARTVPVAATAKEVTALEAPPSTTPCCVTALAVTAEAPLPVSTPVSVVAPVPPLGTVTGAAMSMFRVLAPPVRVKVLPEELMVAKAGSAPVDPMRTWPLVPAFVPPIEELPSPNSTPWAV